MGLVYPSAIVSKPRGLVAAGALTSPATLPGYLDWLDLGSSQAKTDGGCDFDNVDDVLSITDASQTGLDLTATDFTLAGWIKFDSVAGVDPFCTKFLTTGNQRGYYFHRNTTLLQAYLSPDGSAATVVASPAVTIATGQWYFVALRFNNTTKEGQLSISNPAAGGALVHGAATVVVGAGVIFNNTAPFTLGGDSEASPGLLDGQMANWGAWTRRYTDGELTTLADYSNGGKSYAQLAAGELTSLLSFWNLAEASGQRRDKVGSNHLTATGSPIPVFANSAVYNASDEECVTSVITTAGSWNFVQTTTATLQPTYESTAVTTPFLQFDGVDDVMSFTTSATLTGGFWIAWVSRLTRGTPANETILGNSAGSTIFLKQVSTTQTVITDGTNTRTFTHAAQSGAAVHIITGNIADGLKHFMNGIESAAAGTSFEAITFNRLGRDGTGTHYGAIDLTDLTMGSGSVLSITQINLLGQFLA